MCRNCHAVGDAAGMPVFVYCFCDASTCDSRSCSEVGVWSWPKTADSTVMPLWKEAFPIPKTFFGIVRKHAMFHKRQMLCVKKTTWKHASESLVVMVALHLSGAIGLSLDLAPGLKTPCFLVFWTMVGLLKQLGLV